jgi:hypothetical protein
MRMRRFSASILIICLAIPIHTFAQVPDNSNRQWPVVTSLQANGKLEIHLKNGTKAKGALNGLSETGLTLSDKTGTTSIDRADILKIYVVRSRKPLKATAIGAGVGAAAGAVVGAASPDTSFSVISKTEAAVFTTALGTVLGAITGLTIGLIRHKRLLIYQNP